MHGVKRVIIFCILIVILPATLIIIPLYLRKTVFADVIYPVAESDIIEIRDGISSIFCEQHSLRMSSNFNAFQLRSRPEISTNRKHIRLKKSMTLPDDTLEYWGFYLMRGAKVHLKFCSRYDGSRILVVKGQRELRTCGLLEHNKNKLSTNLAQGHEQVRVFFEDITEIAANVNVEDLEANTNTNLPDENFMETENHAGEDLAEDQPLNLHAMSGTTPPPEKTTKLPRAKKLKKGTPNSMRNQKAAENTVTATPTQRIGLRTNSEEYNRMHTLDEEQNNNSTEKNTSAEGKYSTERSHSAEKKTSTEKSGRHRRDQQQDQLRYEAAYSLKHQTENEHRKQALYDQLYKRRTKREHVYNRKYSHGGNAANFTGTDESNSISSFENGLFECYNGAILLAEGFPPSADCLNTHFLENGSHRMMSKHDITEDGYYYYIFYSDNDLVRNDIHAIFDIYKPTFQYSNVSNSQACVNATNCTFPIGFLSNEIVIVEVPTRDGIEHEEDDITYLISTCHPRTEIYAIFPITVLILILSCSFL